MPSDAPAVRYITVWPGPRKVQYVRMDLFDRALGLTIKMLHEGRNSWTKHQSDTLSDRIEALKAMRDGFGPVSAVKGDGRATE